MQKLALLCAGFAVMGHANRLQTQADQVDQASDAASALSNLLLALESEGAFTPSSPAVRFAAPVRSSLDRVQMLDSDQGELSRRAVLAGAAMMSLGAFSKPASAGYWYDLGVEKLAPSKMEKDDDAASSPEVKDALKSLLKLKKLTYGIKEKLVADKNLPETDINIFEVGQVKDILNKFSNQFEEESSRPTIDLYSRQVTGDLNSIKATTLNKPATRTPKQYATVQGWVDKLDSDVARILTYANPKDIKELVATIK